MNSFFKISVLVLLFTACNYSNEELAQFDAKIKAYNAKYKLGLRPTGSGVYLKIDSLGTGRPIQTQDSIWVSYTLKLITGKIIEVQDQPIGLPVSGLIKGWQEVLYQLPVGSQLRCLIPPQLGYGKSGQDKIGKDKMLYFKMAVIDAK